MPSLLSTARKITSVITAENSYDWIEKAKTLTQPKLEREVARVNPKAAVQEKAKYVTAERMRLEIGVSEELMKKIRRAQDLESSSKSKAASLEDVLEAMTELYLERRDPVRVEKRIEKKKAARVEVAHNANLRFSRTAKPKSAALVKRQALARDNGQCTHPDKDGVRCTQTRYVHAHHVIPREFGGADTVENLTTLCSFHHGQVHANLLL